MPMPARHQPKPRVSDGPAPAGSIRGIEVPRPSCGPIVHADGPVPSRLYVLGERAGAEEYRDGVPFVGRAGKTLREWFHFAGLDLDNFRRWNVCIDYKKDNLNPRGWEIKRDRLEVETDIIRCQPSVVVAVGVHATKWCLKRRVKLGTEHGRKIEVQIGDHKAFCVPIYHPSTYGRIERAEMGKADVLIVAGVLRDLSLASEQSVRVTPHYVEM
jgi:uracil-DNA glycosylase family 4